MHLSHSTALVPATTTYNSEMAPEAGGGGAAEKWRFVIVLGRSVFYFFHQGLLKAYGVLIPSLVVQFNSSHSLVGFIASLQYTMTFLACPPVQQLIRLCGTRPVGLAGGLLVGGSMICACFAAIPAVLGLLLVVAGVGLSMVQQTTALSLKEYYGDQFGSMNTLAMMVSIVGGISMPILTQKLLVAYGLGGSLLILGGFSSNLIAIGASTRPPALQSGGTRQRSSGDVAGTSTEEPVDIEDAEDVGPSQETPRKTCTRCGGILLSTLRALVCIVGKTFAFAALRNELAFTLLFLPCQILIEFVFIGWALFVVSYATSVGVDQDEAPFLLVMGAIGGCVNRVLIIFILRRNPKWSLHIYTFNAILLIPTFLFYRLSESFTNILACSFATGFGVYGACAAYFASVSVSVSQEHFPEILAISYFLSGIGIPVSGAATGYMRDVTENFVNVFMGFSGLAGLIASMSLIHMYVQRTKRAQSANL